MSTEEIGDNEFDAGDEDERYAELHLGGSSYVVYDSENHQAWIQSETTVPLDELQ